MLVIMNEILSSTFVSLFAASVHDRICVCYLCMQQLPLALGPFMEQEVFLKFNLFFSRTLKAA